MGLGAIGGQFDLAREESELGRGAMFVFDVNAGGWVVANEDNGEPRTNALGEQGLHSLARLSMDFLGDYFAVKDKGLGIHWPGAVCNAEG